jgi:hypothetical protein
MAADGDGAPPKRSSVFERDFYAFALSNKDEGNSQLASGDALGAAAAYDQALACIEVALGHGLRVFDASVAGAGGCPFAPGAAGNVSTEAVCDLMQRKGFETGIDRAALDEASAFLRGLLGRVTP